MFFTCVFFTCVIEVLKKKNLECLIDMVAGQQSVGFKDISVCKVCHFTGDSLAIGCVLTVSDSPVNKQKAANDFFFLANSCLMYSASWMHSASSDVAQPTACMSKGPAAGKPACKILQSRNSTLTEVCHFSIFSPLMFVASLAWYFSSKKLN